MYVCSLQELIIRLFLGQETLGEGVRDFGRLFHDVTEISRQRHRALAVGFQLAQRSRHRRLDVERRATYAKLFIYAAGDVMNRSNRSKQVTKTKRHLFVFHFHGPTSSK